MSWLVWFLFESRAALGAALFTVSFVLLVYWRRSGRVRPLLVGLALALVLLVIQALVVTHREQATRILSRVEADIVAGQTANLAETLSPQFEAGGWSAAEFVELVARQYERVDVRELNHGRLQVLAQQANQFDVDVAYQADVDFDQYRGWVRTRWTITFQRTALGWRIVRIQPIHIDGVPQPDWDRLDLH